MADADLDSVRRAFADLTGLFEDAAHIASEGQGIKALDGGSRQLRRISITMNRLQRRVIMLERRLR